MRFENIVFNIKHVFLHAFNVSATWFSLKKKNNYQKSEEAYLNNQASRRKTQMQHATQI